MYRPGGEGQLQQGEQLLMLGQAVNNGTDRAELWMEVEKPEFYGWRAEKVSSGLKFLQRAGCHRSWSGS